MWFSVEPLSLAENQVCLSPFQTKDCWDNKLCPSLGNAKLGEHFEVCSKRYFGVIFFRNAPLTGSLLATPMVSRTLV